MNDIPEFGGDAVPSVKFKLNEMVRAINEFKNIRGDEQFISVARAVGGGTVAKLNIDQVLARIPKQNWGRFFPVLIKVDGGVPGDYNTAVTCSFTYSVYDLDFNPLTDGAGAPITTLTPAVYRVNVCKYNTPTDYSLAAAFNDADGTLRLYDVAEERILGATATNILAIQILDSSQEIQVQTQDQLILDKKDPNDWVTIYTGDTCPGS